MAERDAKTCEIKDEREAIAAGGGRARKRDP